MKNNEITHDILFMERATARYAPPKKWPWRRKFAHILDVTELRLESAIQCHPEVERLDAAAIVEFRRAILAMRRIFSAPGIGYHEAIRRADFCLEASQGREDLAFIALFELLVFRLRHLDAHL